MIFIHAGSETWADQGSELLPPLKVKTTIVGAGETSTSRGEREKDARRAGGKRKAAKMRLGSQEGQG